MTVFVTKYLKTRGCVDATLLDVSPDVYKRAAVQFPNGECTIVAYEDWHFTEEKAQKRIMELNSMRFQKEIAHR